MTTQADSELLERIARFDKSTRRITVSEDTTVIAYDRELNAWGVALLTKPGDTVIITDERIPVTATNAEMLRILPMVPAPEGDRGATIIEIRGLVEQAQSQLVGAAISQNNINSALWRLVDAAGLLSRIASPDAQGKKNNITGRGFFVEGGADVPPRM